MEYTNKRSDGGPGEDKSAAYIAYANKVFLRVIFVPAVLITAWLSLLLGLESEWSDLQSPFGVQ